MKKIQELNSNQYLHFWDGGESWRGELQKTEDWPFIFAVNDDFQLQSFWISDLVLNFGHASEKRWISAITGTTFSFKDGWRKFSLNGVIVGFKNKEDAVLFKLIYG